MTEQFHHVSRREFLQASAIAAAYGALGVAAPGVAAAAEGGGITWSKAPCRYCGTGCSTMVGVKNDKIVALRGDELSGVNQGLLCVKGYHQALALYGKDRLTHPMIRSRRTGKMVRADWDDALDLIANTFSETIANHGADSVGMYGSGQWTIPEGYAALKWIKAGIGTNNIDPNARLCMASAVMGFVTTFQSDEPMGCYDDLDLCDLIVCWGNNSAEMHPILFNRILANKRQRRHVQIVDIATRRTRTTLEADHYLEFVPHTDLALANAFAYVIVHEIGANGAFINQNVTFRAGKTNIGYGLEDDFTFADEPREISFDEYAAFLKDYTPEKVAELSGVPAAQIREIGRKYADPEVNVVSLWCMGVNQHSRGTWMNNLINNLHLLTGKISQPGSGPFSLTGQPSACGTAREVGTLSNRLPADMVVMKAEHRQKAAEIWNVPVEKIPPVPGYHTMAMFRALDRGDLKALWIQVTNPMQTLPNADRYRKAMARGDAFVVVSDVYPTVTTDLATVVLPSCLWVEKSGMFGNSERRTQQWDALVPPPGEAKPDVWQIVEVAKRMGMGHLFDYGDEPLDQALFNEYRQFTLGTGKDLADYETYRKAHGLRWPVVNGRETRWRYKGGEDPYVAPGRDVHFYKAKGYGERAAVWARPYEPPAESPDQEYPFWLCTGRVLEHWHTGTMTRRVPQLHRAMPHSYVELHPDDAARLAIANGDTVRLVTRRGAIELPANIGGRGTPAKGNVFVPFFEEEKLINLLTLDSYCPISAEPDYKKCAVRIEKA